MSLLRRRVDRRELPSYFAAMRIVVVAVVWLGIAAPALAQQCDVSTPRGDIFRAEIARGTPALGWDVKRFEHLGEESEHFSRPALSLTFSLGSDGRLTGPLQATVSITSNSDLTLGAAPPMSAMRLRAKVDARPAIEWNAASGSGEVLLAKALRDAWPQALLIDIVAPDGTVAASAAYDVAARKAIEATASGLPTACFR